MCIPGKPVAYNYGLLLLIYGLLYGIVACYFRPLGVPGRYMHIHVPYAHTLDHMSVLSELRASASKCQGDRWWCRLILHNRKLEAEAKDHQDDVSQITCRKDHINATLS